MTTREAEVATFLSADAELGTLAPGGIYANDDLSIAGLTDMEYMTDVWVDGTFQTTIVVRQRAPIPTGDLQSVRSQRTSMSQVVEVWAYGKTSEAIEAVLNRVYALLMGKRLTAAFSATWVGGLPITQAPELPAGHKVGREDFRVVSIRRPVTV